MSLTKRLSLWSGPGTQQRGRWALEAPAPQPGRSLGRRPCSAGTHPPSALPAPSKNPNRSRLCADSSDSRWDPGVPSWGGWPGARRPDGVCRGRAARLVQKRLSAPSSLPATRPSPQGREDTASPDSIKQVYSHFRKTNSRTGHCLPWAGYEIMNRRPEGGAWEGRSGGWGATSPTLGGVGQIN